MTAPSATELPTAQPNVPANSRHPGPRAVPSVSSVLILPPGPIVDRHRRPQERLQAARRPPAYPNQARIIAPVAPSPLFRCPHAVHRCPSVDSGLQVRHSSESPHLHPRCRRRDSSRHSTGSPQRPVRVCCYDYVHYSGRSGREPPVSEGSYRHQRKQTSR